MDFYKKRVDSDATLICTLKDSNLNLLQLSEEFKLKITGIEKDKEVYKTRGDKFEEEFLTCSKTLQKEVDSKPSRLVWYGAGVVSSLVLVLAAFIIIK